MKKRILSVFLSLCMMLTLLPTVALAADPEEPTAPSTQAAEQLPEAVDGVITLTSDVTLSGTWNVGGSTGNVIAANTIDLNGHTLTVGRLDMYTALTIKDGSQEQTGRLTSNGDQTAVVWNGGALTLESGSIENTQEGTDGITIFNMGTVTVDGGELSGATLIYNTAYNGGQVKGNIVCNINGGTLHVSMWGICAMGPGFDSNGDVDNSKVTVNITGGTIIGTEGSEGQGFATNASSGQRAGFTLNMTGGTINMGAKGCGMYLPAIGETNISGGSVIGNQGIRIAAGTLNITGGTITGTAVLSENADLISGGSGGTEGAIVIGKASGGYVGDISVTISEGVTINNTASEDGVKPTIVVSDKNMAQNKEQTVTAPDGKPSSQTFNYSKSSIAVVVDGANIAGDVVKISNLSENAQTSDGGNTSLRIQNAEISGNVANQSKTGLTIVDSKIGGKVTNESSGSTAVLGDSTITGESSNTGAEEGGSLYIEGSKEESSTVAVNQTTAKSYTDLADALADAQAGDTVILQKEITVQRGSAADTAAVYQVPVGVTLDGNGKTLTAGAENWGTVEAGKTATHILAVASTDSTASTVTTIKNLTIVGHASTKSGIHAYGPGANVRLEDVTIQNCGTVGVQVNGAKVTAENLSTSGNAWGGVNLDTGSGLSSAPSFTLTGTNDLQEGSAIYSDTKDATIQAEGLTAVVIEDDSAKIRYTASVEKLVSDLNTFLGEEGKLSVDDFVAQVDGTLYTDFAAAMQAVKENSTITLRGDVTVEDTIKITAKGVTFDGGNHTITLETDKPLTGTGNNIPPVGSVLEVSADNVTIKNVELQVKDGKVKHGVQFYTAEGGMLDNVTINNSAWTGVLVNGSQVTIKDSTLNPTGDGVYANIEYAMGANVTDIPAIHLENVTGTDDVMVWADHSTVTRVKDAKSDDSIADEDSAADAILDKITSANNTSFVVSIQTSGEEGEAPENTTKPSTKPSSGGSSGGTTRYTVTAEETANGTVTVSPKSAGRGTTVTITVKPDEGYELDRLTVTDKDGKTVTLTDKGDGKYTFTMPAGKVTVEAVFAEMAQSEPEPAELPFTDVAEGAWYYDAVSYVYENGMMEGTGGTLFQPAATTTRGMIVTMLYRLEGEPAAGQSTFTDVAAGAWYTSAVAWASANGIVEGYGNDRFGPDDTITREQMAAILYRYAQYKGYDVTASDGSLSGYTDAGQVSAWAQTAMVWANAKGLITGTGAATLNPLGNASRAEVAAILMRFVENVAG